MITLTERISELKDQITTIKLERSRLKTILQHYQKELVDVLRHYRSARLCQGCGTPLPEKSRSDKIVCGEDCRRLLNI